METANDAMREMVQNIWRQYILPKTKELFADMGVLRTYRAKVVAVGADNQFTIQAPFEDAHTLPGVGSAASLEPGDECTVLVIGDPINSIVLGDGTLSNL